MTSPYGLSLLRVFPGACQVSQIVVGARIQVSYRSSWEMALSVLTEAGGVSSNKREEWEDTTSWFCSEPPLAWPPLGTEP